MREWDRRVLQARKVVASLASSSMWPGMRRGVFPTVDHFAVLHHVRPRIVIDVGAHRGQFALAVRRELPGTRVISFEPQPDAADIYRRVVCDADLRTVALGASVGTATLHLSRASDSSSLRVIGGNQTAYFPGTDEVGEIAVNVSTVDAEVVLDGAPGPVLLKIDVQGTELDVLRGAQRTLAAIEWVYVELSFVELYLGQDLAPAVIAHLDRAGFDVAGVYNVARSSTGVALQADWLFRARGERD